MRKGFTLLELLTVVIIVAILASLAVPQFFRIAERARAAEGVNILGSIRSAQLRYYSEHSVLTNTIGELDIDVPSTRFFGTMTIPNPAYTAGNEVIGTIQRNNSSNPGYGTYTLSIQGDGDITCAGGNKCPPGF